MNWLRRSGVWDEKYVKKAKRRPIVLPPSIDQLFPPPGFAVGAAPAAPEDTPIQPILSPTGDAAASHTPGEDPLDDNGVLELVDALDGATPVALAMVASPVAQGNHAFPAASPRSPAVSPAAAAERYQLPAAFPPARSPTGHAGAPARSPTSPAAPAPRWRRPTHGESLCLADSSPQAREQLRQRQRQSYKAQMKHRDAPVVVRLPEFDEDDADDDDGGDDSAAAANGSRRRSSGSGGGSAAPARVGQAEVAGTKDSSAPVENTPRGLSRLCTTGLTLLDFVDGVIQMRVMQHQKILTDPPLGVVAQPYDVPRVDARASGADGGAAHESDDERWAIFYHPDPFTYIELAENRQLLTEPRRRAMRRAALGRRADSPEVYGRPEPYVELAHPELCNSALSSFAAAAGDDVSARGSPPPHVCAATVGSEAVPGVGDVPLAAASAPRAAREESTELSNQPQRSPGATAVGCASGDAGGVEEVEQPPHPD